MIGEKGQEDGETDPSDSQDEKGTLLDPESLDGVKGLQDNHRPRIGFLHDFSQPKQKSGSVCTLMDLTRFVKPQSQFAHLHF